MVWFRNSETIPMFLKSQLKNHSGIVHSRHTWIWFQPTEHLFTLVIASWPIRDGCTNDVLPGMMPRSSSHYSWLIVLILNLQFSACVCRFITNYNYSCSQGFITGQMGSGFPLQRPSFCWCDHRFLYLLSLTSPFPSFPSSDFRSSFLMCLESRTAPVIRGTQSKSKIIVVHIPCV